jgi:uncharacterized membrane protein YfcA
MLSLDDPWQWVACLAAASLIGMSKGGLAGLGALATPIVTLALPPVVAVGLLLPVLISQDLVSVWSFRREWDRWIIAWMLPGAIVGIAIGWRLADSIDESMLSAAIGLLSALFAVQQLWKERGHAVVASSESPGWIGALFGIATGFTSQVAHAGAPPFQMWVTPRRLPHHTYIGTAAVLFAAINLIKVPAFVALGALNPAVLKLSAVLVPVGLASTLVTLRFLRRIPSPTFYRIANWLMLGLGVYLVAKAGFG